MEQGFEQAAGEVYFGLMGVVLVKAYFARQFGGRPVEEYAVFACFGPGKLLAEAKVDDFGAAIVVDEYVARSHVPVQYAVFLEVGEGGYGVGEDVCPAFAAAAGAKAVDWLAVNVLHLQVAGLAGRVEVVVVDAHDVGMAEAKEYFYFVDETPVKVVGAAAVFG